MRKFVVILAGLLGAAGLAGQSAGGSGVSVRFRALAFDESIDGAYYLDGENLRQLDIPNQGFTREISYQGPSTLRFVTIDGENARPQPLSPEMTAATQRLRRAQAVILQASDESAQTRRLLGTLNQRAGESARAPDDGDMIRIEALNTRLRQLADILAAATKETEETNLQILRLESSPTKPKPEGRKTGGKDPRPTATPTAELTFPRDGRFLLLFSAAGNGHQILAMDDGEGVFPFGSFQFVNLTGKDAEIRMGERKVPLRANARTVIKNPAADHRYALAEIHTKASDGFDLGHVYRALQHPDVRTLVFLLPMDDEPHAIRSRSVEDRRPAGPPTAK